MLNQTGTRRIANEKKIGTHIWTYEDSFYSKEKAERAGKDYEEDGLLTKVIKGRSFDDDFHLYFRKP